jgi:hypothetical protein
MTLLQLNTGDLKADAIVRLEGRKAELGQPVAPNLYPRSLGSQFSNPAMNSFLAQPKNSGQVCRWQLISRSLEISWR